MVFKIFGATFDYYVLADSLDGALERVRPIEPAVNDGVALDGHEGVALDLVVVANVGDYQYTYDMTYSIYAIAGDVILKVYDGERGRRELYSLYDWHYYIQAR